MEIRDTIGRYVHARSAVLSRSSVSGLINDLIPFGLFLGRAPLRGEPPQPARAPPRRRVPGVEPHTRLGGAASSEISNCRRRSCTARCSSAQLPRRHDPLGMGRPASSPPGVRVRRASDSSATTAGPCTRHRHCTHGRRRPPPRSLRPRSPIGVLSTADRGLEHGQGQQALEDMGRGGRGYLGRAALLGHESP